MFINTFIKEVVHCFDIDLVIRHTAIVYSSINSHIHIVTYKTILSNVVYNLNDLFVL